MSVANPCLPAHRSVLLAALRPFHRFGAPNCLQLTETAAGCRELDRRVEAADARCEDRCVNARLRCSTTSCTLASARPASPGASRTCEAVCGRRSTPWPAWLRSEPAARCPAEWWACHRWYRARAECGDAAARVVQSPTVRSRASGEDLEAFWDPAEAEGGARILIGPSIHIGPRRRGWQLSAAGGPTLRPSDSGRSSGPVRDLPPTNRPNGYALRVTFAGDF